MSGQSKPNLLERKKGKGTAQPEETRWRGDEGRGGGQEEGGKRKKKDCGRVSKRGVRGKKEVGQGKRGGQMGKD